MRHPELSDGIFAIDARSYRARSVNTRLRNVRKLGEKVMRTRVGQQRARTTGARDGAPRSYLVADEVALRYGGACHHSVKGQPNRHAYAV